jgi:hypothetical protein
MKTFLPMLVFLVLGSAWASAQNMSGMSSPMSQPTTSAPATAHDVTGFAAPSYAPGPGVSPQAMKTPPNLHPDLKPKLGGILVDGAKYGAVMVSPMAPASYGMGERYLSAPSQQGYDLQHESGPAAQRQSGGLKLFSIEF